MTVVHVGKEEFVQRSAQLAADLLARQLEIPVEPFVYGIGDKKILTTLCPGGKERMRRLMEVVRHGRVDLTPLLTHTFPLDEIKEAYDLFGKRAGGVIKVAIKP